MNWALIATVAQPLTYYSNSIGDWIKTEVIIGTVINIIVYDGVSEYSPPAGTRLAQITNTANIGDTGY